MSRSVYLLPRRLATPSWGEIAAVWRAASPASAPLSVEPACSVLTAPLHLTVRAGSLVVALDVDRASELGFGPDWTEDFGAHNLSSDERSAITRAWLATDLVVTLTFARAPTDLETARGIVLSVARTFDAAITVPEIGLFLGVAAGLYTPEELDRLLSVHGADQGRLAPAAASGPGLDVARRDVPDCDPTRAAGPAAARETMRRVIAHELVHIDPAGQRRVNTLMAGSAAKVAEDPRLIGTYFDRARKLVGYEVALACPPGELSSSLRKMRDRGVALFVRGNVGGGHRVTVTIDGTSTEIAGGASEHNSSGRWLDALGVALVLRDAEALRALCAYHPGNFEDVGPDTAYFVSLAWGLIGLITGTSSAEERLEEAFAGAKRAADGSEWARRIGCPTVGVALAILGRDQARFTEQLVAALEGTAVYRGQKGEAERADTLVPFLLLGLTALAHDRGMRIEVESDYLPTWLVAGDPSQERGVSDSVTPREEDVRSARSSSCPAAPDGGAPQRADGGAPRESWQFSLGSEHAPDSPWGMDLFAFEADRRFRYENRRAGHVLRVRTGVVSSELHTRLLGWLRESGFPVVPEHPRPPGASYLRIVRAAEGNEQTALLAMSAAERMPGYGPLLAALDPWASRLRSPEAGAVPEGFSEDVP